MHKHRQSKPVFDVSYLYWEMSFDEIGKELGLSKQRVEQLYLSAMHKLRQSGALQEFRELIAQRNPQ